MGGCDPTMMRLLGGVVLGDFVRVWQRPADRSDGKRIGWSRGL